MRVLIVHNEYGALSGEEVMVNRIVRLLEGHKHAITRFRRSSAEIESMIFGKARAFFSGIYSLQSRLAVRHVLREQRPEVALIQNLFPLISPSVLPEISAHGVPIVMRCANFRLLCPNGLFWTHGEVCEKCRNSREYRCVLKNCEDNLAKSLGYALRTTIARKMRFYHDNVTMYYTQTQFQKKKLICDGIPSDRIDVIPNMADAVEVGDVSRQGNYVGYAGRISGEKGIPIILSAARRYRQAPFQLAGEYEHMSHLTKKRPDNVEFRGFLDATALKNFYSDCRIIILASICYEGFPGTIVEAMLHGKAVVCSRIGGLPEIVEHGKTGLLFEPSNAEELAEKVRYLWERPELCRQMGQAGREKALREYAPEKYYARLMAVHKKAVELGPRGTNHKL